MGVPARGATAAGIFSPCLLGVKPMSQVYLEGHLAAYINSTLVADEDTKQALAGAIERESGWVRKSSTVCECKNILEEMREEARCSIPSPDNCANFKVTVRVEKPKILAEVKRRCRGGRARRRCQNWVSRVKC